MAKKRKSHRSDTGPAGPKEVDPADARLGPINTFEDVAGSEDEYFIERDRIMFDEEPISKRQRLVEEEEAFLEASDEEVLDLDANESDNDTTAQPQRPKKSSRKAQDSEDDEAQEPEEEGDEGWWGSSRKEYYNADNIETEADALQEEAESKRLQQKRLSKMAEEDFIFDEDGWRGTSADAEEDQEVVTEVLADVEITDDMGPEERQRLLEAKYPEFNYLADEFLELHPLLPIIRREAQGKSGKSIEAIKHWVLGSYLAALGFYFAILTSPARDAPDTKNKTLDPAELRDHDIMETIMRCREAWHEVRLYKSAGLPTPPEETLSPSGGILQEPENMDINGEEPVSASKLGNKKAKTINTSEAEAERLRLKKQAAEIEASVADLSTLLQKPQKLKKNPTKVTLDADQDDHSDFGEEDALDARTAQDKAARRKSLRFYTSEIAQKSNRRDKAGHGTGGDTDIPYRERFKDREARLNAAAERRGQRGSKHGADLDENSGSDDEGGDDGGAAAIRDEALEYYDMVTLASKKKKEQKTAYYDALSAATALDRVVETEEIGEDGKRKISYMIEKNKGLAPKRKKEVRNPRVKKKKKFEEKQKKLRSMRATYKTGGEGRGGYGGELTGINSSIVKARKL
jgi:U3 small nucleolar RNA-associated protein 3